MRPLTKNERSFIASVANLLSGNERVQLLADLENATANSVTADGARVLFDISSYQRPPYRGQHPFGVEGRMVDRDGAELLVLLHADENGRLLELEIVRGPLGDLIDPNWNTLVLVPRSG